MEDDKVARSGGTRAGAGGPRKLKGQGKKRAGAGLPASVNIADSEEEDIYAPLDTTHETSESMISVWQGYRPLTSIIS